MQGRTSRFEGYRGGAVLLALLAVACMSPTVAQAASSGRCASVEVEAEILLPDGSVHPPGTLTLCDTRAFSPVASLHKTFVNGMPVGLLMSRRKKSEGDEDSRPEVMFLRDVHGRLQLFGYALPTGGEKTTFLLARPVRAHRPGGRNVAGKLPPEVPDSLVLVAASTH